MKVIGKWLPRFLGLAAIVVFVVGVFSSLRTYYHNKYEEQSATQAIARANTGKPSSAPSTVKPSGSAFASYTVPPNKPKYLIIPKLNVNARIYAVGMTKDGAMGTPSNVYDAAWYNASSLPGQPGAMLIDGHIASWRTHGVFYDLKDLLPGDSIQIARGDSKTITYKVIRTHVYPDNEVNMNAVLAPITPGKPGLNLISCSGEVIPGTNKFNQRIVVFTSQLES